MKKLALSLLFFATALTATEVTKGKNPTVVVIEGRLLLQSSDKGREIENKLNKIQEDLQKEIKALEEKIQKEMASIQSKAKLMDAETLEREQDKMMKLRKEYELKAGQAQEEFQRKVNIELGKFQKEVQEVIKDAAIKNGWDIVVMKESGEIVYASDKVNATNDVLLILNKKHNETKKSTQPTAALPAKK